MSIREDIISDLKILTGGNVSMKAFLEWYFFPRGEMFRFMVWYRVLLYYRRKYGKLGSIIPYYILRHYEFKYGIHFHPGISVGRGLHVVHGDGVHLNCKSIGDNVTIYHGVTLGIGKGGVPTIGNNVTIYPNAVIIGGITIGDGATIGANTFVNKNVDPGDTVAGIPGKSIRRK